MPIYEYQCKDCGYLHEALQKLSDAPLTDCPACGASALRKKVSAAAFRLKGSGWYETDFKSGDKKNLAGDSSKEGASKSDGASGDSKAKETKTTTDKTTTSSKSAGGSAA